MTSNETTSFYGLLSEDHRRTESQLVKLCEIATTRDSAQTLLEMLDIIALELHRHLVCEERSLFPVLSQYRPMILMEVEHDDLLESLDDLRRRISESPWKGFAPEEMGQKINAFAERLRAHILEEDRGVFRYADKTLEPEEKALAARKLRETMDLLIASTDPTPPTLNRPNPNFVVAPIEPEQLAQKPIVFQTLFEEEHVTIQRLDLKAGNKLAMHWAGQHQWLTPLSGECAFVTKTDTVKLTPGVQVTLEPKLWFSLEAETDCRFLLLKVWPRPYFVRG